MGEPEATAAERRAAAIDAILNSGQLPGEAGSSQRTRVVTREQFEQIEADLRARLGEPDQVIDVPGKGRVEVWEFGVGEYVRYRDFSTSGSRGYSADETIDV